MFPHSHSLPHSCCAYLQKPGPHRLALPSGGAGHSCCPPAWWQCCCQRGPSAPSTSAPHSRMSNVWRCRTPAEHRLHPDSSCVVHKRHRSATPTQASYFFVVRLGFAWTASWPVWLLFKISHRVSKGQMVQYITYNTVQATSFKLQSRASVI